MVGVEFIPSHIKNIPTAVVRKNYADDAGLNANFGGCRLVRENGKTNFPMNSDGWLFHNAGGVSSTSDSCQRTDLLL